MTISVPPSPFTTLSQRLWVIVTALRVMVAARGGKDRAMSPMVVLVWSRIGHLAFKFETMVARLLAGRLVVLSGPRKQAVRIVDEIKPLRVFHVAAEDQVK